MPAGREPRATYGLVDAAGLKELGGAHTFMLAALRCGDS